MKRREVWFEIFVGNMSLFPYSPSPFFPAIRVGCHTQCCQLIYIYIPNLKNLVYILKNLVYFQSAWYIIFWFGIYEKFGIFLSEGLVEILSQFIWLINKVKTETDSGVEAI